MSEPDYKEMYEELRRELRIHHAHTHERTIEYIRMHNDRIIAANEVIGAANSFLHKATETMKMTW